MLLIINYVGKSTARLHIMGSKLCFPLQHPNATLQYAHLRDTRTSPSARLRMKKSPILNLETSQNSLPNRIRIFHQLCLLPLLDLDILPLVMWRIDRNQDIRTFFLEAQEKEVDENELGLLAIGAVRRRRRLDEAAEEDGLIAA